MIKHIFAISIQSGAASGDVQAFLQKTAMMLPSIPGVENFAIYRQVNPENGFQYLLSMEFESDKVYQAYQDHPLHAEYVRDVWMKIAGELMVFDLEKIGIEASE